MGAGFSAGLHIPRDSLGWRPPTSVGGAAPSGAAKTTQPRRRALALVAFSLDVLRRQKIGAGIHPAPLRTVAVHFHCHLSNALTSPFAHWRGPGRNVLSVRAAWFCALPVLPFEGDSPEKEPDDKEGDACDPCDRQ